MSLRQISFLTPVVSPPVAPVSTIAKSPAPAAGAVWGAPGNFSYSSTAVQTDAPTSQDVLTTELIEDPSAAPLRLRRYYGAGLTARQTRNFANGSSDFFATSDGAHIDIQSWIFRVRGLVGLGFSWSEVLPRPHIYSSQPIRTTTYDLDFLPRAAMRRGAFDLFADDYEKAMFEIEPFMELYGVQQADANALNSSIDSFRKAAANDTKAEIKKEAEEADHLYSDFGAAVPEP